ncbi:DUF4652 domain-containing protein [Clostridium aestuarii]|uniref:DUF4652 domain-containing protein n=1 Tax=Clostridium aestuarii TaxID=338193 RepID=A0ABT4CWU9_9CLOT|nr:DUF4652 domain-containing protein [Clostridium aestuarii]MCY6483451.1 DUF4652 domain-containing protein [Clostridium aestuarii]
MKSNYKKIWCYMLSILLIAVTTSFIGCSDKKIVKENNKVATNKNESNTDDNNKENQSKKDEENNKGDNEVKEDLGKKQEQQTNIKFVKHQLDKTSKPEFATEWQDSLNKKLSACIEGKGPDAVEEGIGKIYVKNIKNGEKWSIQVMDEAQQNTPKSLIWLDDENIVSIVGLGYGTVSLGGDLYKINVKTGEALCLYDTKSSKKEVISAKKDKDKLELEVLVYDDEEYISTHTENKVINLK